MSIFQTAIGWLAPAECIVCGEEGESLCEVCTQIEILPFGERCGICSQLSINATTCKKCQRLGTPRHIWISTDYQETPKKLIQVFKYGHQRIAAKSIAKTMAHTFWAFNNSGLLKKESYLVVPVPTASSRLRQRGFDHAELLAKNLANELGLKFYPALRRVGQSRQVGSPRKLRLSQQVGKYEVSHPDKIRGQNILIIDDVVTSGGTLSAVYKELRKTGAKHIDALAFAKRI